MFHRKVMVVDDRWVSVGSTNFDNRSLAVNDEANLNVYDAAFARASGGVRRGPRAGPPRQPRTMGEPALAREARRARVRDPQLPALAPMSGAGEPIFEIGAKKR